MRQRASPLPLREALDATSITELIRQREALGNPRIVEPACQAHASFVRRLACESVLTGHDGCVNHLRWNRAGTLLGSGSDDLTVRIWDYATRKQREVINTGHSLNIFAVCFVPETNDHIIATGMSVLYDMV